MSNKHVKHQGKKEKARRLAQIKKRAAAARKKAPKKRPVVQEPEPQEAFHDPLDCNWETANINANNPNAITAFSQALALREERIGDSIREVYEDASRGTELPEVLVTNGGVLNELTETADFDPSEAYVVTAQGIDLLQKPEPEEAQPKDPFSFPDGVTQEDHQRLIDARFTESEPVEVARLVATDDERAIVEAIAEVAANMGQPDSPTPRQLAVLTNITGSDE